MVKQGIQKAKGEKIEGKLETMEKFLGMRKLEERTVL